MADDTYGYKLCLKDLCAGGNVDHVAIYKNGTGVGALKASIGGSSVATMIYRMLSDMCVAFNTYDAMTHAQKMDTVEDIIIDLHWVTIEDLAVFFDMLKKQRLGRVANRMDAGVIWEFWNEYMKLRQDAFYKNETQHNTNLGEKIGFNKVSDTIKKISDEYKKK